MTSPFKRALCCFLLWAAASTAWPGGSGVNVAIVANRASLNSLALANYYREQRNVPPQNVFYLNWTGRPVEWSRWDFENVLAAPLQSMIAARGLSNQVDYVVLSIDIPYRVRDFDSANSTTSALFYGFKSDLKTNSCSLPDLATNLYFRSEGVFRAIPPTLTNAGYLVMMLTSSNLDEAMRVVDQGVSSDSTFPPQPVYLAKSADRLRNVRHYTFDEAVFDNRVLARRDLIRTNTGSPSNLGFIAGYQNGSAQFKATPGMFAAGSMADDLTSFGGVLYERNDQTPLLEFLNAGAAGSFGTVVEPCAYLEKFPLPMNYFYQARGFSLAEAYYQSISHPHQGLLVGEPLAAPFASPALAQWINLPPEARLAGRTNLALRFAAPGVETPVAQVDLFLNGTFYRTLTNIPPAPGNTLNVNIGGRAISYTVRPGATLKTVTSGLAEAINARTNLTRVKATAHGDRIELQGLDITRSGSVIALTSTSGRGTAAALTTFSRASGSALLDTLAYGNRTYLVTNTPAPGDFLQMRITRTNGQSVVHTVTNTSNLKLGELVKALLAKVQADVSLQGSDGVRIEDINMHEDFPYTPYAYGTNDHSGTFTVRSASSGWLPSQIQVALRGSPTFEIEPPGTNYLDENVNDLRPRAHLYISTGITNLAFNFSLDTFELPDGYHELTAVGYEGTHVRTQTRAPVPVLIKNTGLDGTLSAPGGPTVALGSPLALEARSSAAGGTIELHGTGGMLAVASNNPTPVFILDSARLGVGLHSFSALIRNTSGARWRSAPVSVRIVGSGVPGPGFIVSAQPPGATLSWPAVPGKAYEVLQSADPFGPFAIRATLTASNSLATWRDSSTGLGASFYRIRTKD